MNGYIIFEEFRIDKKSLIHLPDNAKKPNSVYYGKVIAVSDGWTGVMGVRYEHKIAVGDIVIPPPSVAVFKSDGRELYFCLESDLWAAAVESDVEDGCEVLFDVRKE